MQAERTGSHRLFSAAPSPRAGTMGLATHPGSAGGGGDEQGSTRPRRRAAQRAGGKEEGGRWCTPARIGSRPAHTGLPAAPALPPGARRWPQPGVGGRAPPRQRSPRQPWSARSLRPGVTARTGYFLSREGREGNTRGEGGVLVAKAVGHTRHMRCRYLARERFALGVRRRVPALPALLPPALSAGLHHPRRVRSRAAVGREAGQSGRGGGLTTPRKS